MFQAFSDRILRYELTLRCNYLNYLHKKYVFRKTCPLWKRLYSDFMTLEMMKDYNIRVSKRKGKINSKKEKLEYRLTHPYKKPSQQVKNSHKIVSQIISRCRKFIVETDMESHLFNAKSVPWKMTSFIFQKIFTICAW